MNNITITNKGSYYQSSCGAWSENGVVWIEDGEFIEAHNPNALRCKNLRIAFKQQILDQQDEPKPTPEVEVYTGDPIEDEWGRGVFSSVESQNIIVFVTDGDWCAISSKGIVWGARTRQRGFECKFIRISDNPGDLIAKRWKGGE